MEEIKFQDGEIIIDSWTVNYIPSEGGRFTGKLYVTDKNIYFDMRIDNSLSGLFEQIRSGYVSGHGYILIPKQEIMEVSQKKKLFVVNCIILRLHNGETFEFDYGMIDTSKIVEAINSRV